MRCLTVAVSAILMGSLAIFVRHVHSNSIVVTFLRLSFGLLYLTPLIKFVRFEALKNSKVLSVSIVSLLTILFYISSIQTIEMAVSALLLYMAPIYVIVYMLLKGEDVRREAMLSLAFALVGLYLLLSPYCKMKEGIIFGVLSGICYAMYFIIAKDARNFASSVEITFATLLVSTLILSPTVLIYDVGKVVTEDTIWVIGLGLIPTAVPFILLNYGIKFCRKDMAPIIALVEPVSAGIFGYLFFGEVLSLKQVFGALMIISSVAIAVRSGVEG